MWQVCEIILVHMKMRRGYSMSCLLDSLSPYSSETKSLTEPEARLQQAPESFMFLSPQPQFWGYRHGYGHAHLVFVLAPRVYTASTLLTKPPPFDF